MPEQHPETVLIVDFGAQYAQLIARRVRQFHVYSEIVPYATPLEEIRARRPKGIILSGGPASVYDEGAPRVDPGIYELGVPVLGICYGMQLMSIQLGGDVRRSERREYGRAVLHVDRPVGLFEGLPGEMDVWMSHGDSVLEPPPGFEVLAHTERTSTAAIAHLDRRLFGVQFHPEVVHTPLGGLLIESFLTRVCRCRCDWTPESFIERSVREIRQQVGDGHVLAALSGGVDSSVAAALVAQAVGDRLTCVFIDHGFMRAGEPEQVAATFGNRQGLHFVAVDASQRFLARLEGVTDPEVKRRRIGEEFIRVFEAEARKIGQVDFLVQGTLYPDVVESGTATAATIKTHHNVGGLPADMRFQLIEPFRELFKDEVRAVGEALGLPEEIVWRHPFPGPGLAIRIIGEVTPERLRIERTADRIVTEEIDRAGLHRAVWQVFAVLLPMRSVGVMGDGRTYGYTCAVRAVTSEDGMTADWARLPHEVLERIANRIVGEVAEINRVVYDITSKPPGTIEWE